jgi:hypothetical protein
MKMEKIEILTIIRATRARGDRTYQKTLECGELLGGQGLGHGLAIEINDERVRHLWPIHEHPLVAALSP